MTLPVLRWLERAFFGRRLRPANRRPRLEVVVTGCCSGCTEALEMAHDVQERFPSLQVEVIELDGRRSVPSPVVATPSYLLNGQLISLGNPKRETLIRQITERLPHTLQKEGLAGP